jgi:hypothetical protein
MRSRPADVDWREYKALCNRADVWPRWMLEQTAQLLHAAGATRAAEPLEAVLERERPLPKPADHRGGVATDMFVLALDGTELSAVVAAVAAAIAADVRTDATRERGLGGFLEAWQEYQRWQADRTPAPPQP